MNQQRGFHVKSLIGNVIKMDVDGLGKVSGVFLRAQVAIEINKCLRRERNELERERVHESVRL